VEGVHPGRPIRYAIESKGRFKPLALDSYLRSIIGANYVDFGDETMGEEGADHAH
jgi:hypothetical protein